MPQGPSYRDAAVIVSDRAHPALTVEVPAGEPAVQLMDGLFLAQLPHDEAEEYIDACQEAGQNDFGGARQYSQLYSFVRTDPPKEPVFQFDSDERIRTAIQLSRLIVPNSHCTEYAVRVLDRVYTTEPSRRVFPLTCHARVFAFRVITNERDWLTQTDGRELGRLLRRFVEVRYDLPQRVKNALWLTEWGVQIPFFQPAQINAVSGLEALLNAGRYQLRRQFVFRVQALAEAVGMPGVDEANADRFYAARSEGVHGKFVDFERGSDAAKDLALFQRLLQVALRRAIEKEEFARIFNDDDSVRNRWPVPND